MPRVPLKHDRLPDHDRLEPESLRFRVEHRQIGGENSLKTIGLDLELGLEIGEDRIARWRSGGRRCCDTTPSSDASRLFTLIGKLSGSWPL